MKEKTVVITGATSGLGRATALQLAPKGVFVLIIARSNNKANEIIKKIKKEGGKGQFIISDLSSISSTSAYYQSKHLLTSFTYYLSRQLKETDITVNCIHPGFVKTALAQSDYPFPMNIFVPKVFNLCLINKMGLEKWAESKAGDVRRTYFTKPWTLA